VSILAHNRYGKTLVRMVKVDRHDDRHDLVEITAAIGLEGDFETAHTEGDNSKVIPTDTMKNTVYALGRDHDVEPIESFAMQLGYHFVGGDYPQVAAAHIGIEQASWRRAEIDGSPHPHTFERGSAERQATRVVVSRTDRSVESGLEDLVLLKTTDSGFEGFVRDRFTTLRDTDDRLFGTSLSAWWRFSDSSANASECRAIIRACLIGVFAEHKSRSVQHTMHAMGEEALARCSCIDRIHLVMPNKHNLLVDLSPFGLSNDNVVFLPVDEPSGLLEATLERN
jgi:urate oxidase